MVKSDNFLKYHSRRNIARLTSRSSAVSTANTMWLQITELLSYSLKRKPRNVNGYIFARVYFKCKLLSYPINYTDMLEFVEVLLEVGIMPQKTQYKQNVLIVTRMQAKC